MLDFLNKQDFCVKSKKGKILLLFLAFAVPFLIVVLALMALHITPFGDNTIMISDGSAAYLPMLSYLKRMFSGSEGILYSFKNGLGGNEFTELIFGWINPTFLLSLFGSLETLPTVYTWIVAVNLSLSGISMYLFLSQVFGWKFSNLLFSTSYALIGFSVVNSFQLIFYSGVHMLPLMALGLYRILRGKSPLVYILSLGYCILANFFFGYILCIASVVFFLIYMAEHAPELKGKKKKIFLNYTISSLFSGLLPAFALLPALKAISGDGRMNQTALSEFSLSENMPFIQIFTKLITGANSIEEIQKGQPNIFCGILVTALVILFFMNRNIGKRHKIAAGAAAGFYFITFYITALSYVMQGFSHTNWFPYRYSFVLSFLLIFMAAEEYQYLPELTVKETEKCGGILLIAAVLVFSQRYEYITASLVLLDLILLLFIWFGFILYKKDPDKSPERLLAVIILLFVSGNQYANFAVSIGKMIDFSETMKHYQSDIVTAGSITAAVTVTDTSFYRMENEYSRGTVANHDSYLYNYQNAGFYSPMQKRFIPVNIGRLGMPYYSYGNFYATGIPAAVDSLFGIRYVISQRDLTEEKQYVKKLSMDDTSLYINDNALSVGIIGTESLDTIVLGDNAFENLNAVWKGLTGKSESLFTLETNVHFQVCNAFEHLETTSEKLRNPLSDEDSQDGSTSGSDVSIDYSFVAQRDGPVYLFDRTVFTTGVGLGHESMEYLGTYRKGDTVTGKYNRLSGVFLTKTSFEGFCSNLTFAYADNDVLADYSAVLKSRDISVEKASERILTGIVTAAETENRLFFTIPYDEGWTCYIDGEKADIAKSCGCFMTVAVPAGTHTYEMRFFPAWMKAGIIISIVSLAACVVYLILFNKYTQKEEPVTENEPSSDDTAETERTDALPETVSEVLTKEAAT